jgi:hypothetical protein
VSTAAGFSPLWSSSATTATSAAVSLPLSSTYYWRVQVFDTAGNSSYADSVRTVIIDTIPPTVPVHTAPLNGCTTNYASVLFTWTGADIGPSGIKNYAIEVSTSNEFTAVAASTVVTVSSASLALPLSATYYWRITSCDQAGNLSVSSPWLLLIDTIAPPAPALSTPSDDTRTRTTMIAFSWSEVSDSGASGMAGYELALSTDTGFSMVTSSFTAAAQAPLTAGQELYYWRVRAKDRAGNWGAYSSTYTLTIDTTAPVIADNQPNDTVWHSLGNTLYDVDFYDTPGVRGAGLANAQYTVYTATNTDATPSGDPSVTWQDIFTRTLPARATFYLDEWNLSSVWDTLAQGYNFVYVRCFDLAGSSAAPAGYVFSVKKDTAAPAITVNENTVPAWTSTGMPHNIDFSDAGSGVRVSSYTAWTGAGQTGTGKIPWTTIFDIPTPSSLYSNDWQLNFGLLAAGTNYISLRVEDALGTTFEVTDAFRVFKDTIPPSNITGLTAAQGTAAGEVALSWIAPADDTVTLAADRRINSYLVKYKTEPFASLGDFFTTGTTYYQSWSPSLPALTENRAVTALSEGTTYYFGILPVDKGGNFSVGHSTASAWAQRTAPAGITSLVASMGDFPGEVKLSWTAVGDDDLCEQHHRFISHHRQQFSFRADLGIRRIG